MAQSDGSSQQGSSSSTQLRLDSDSMPSHNSRQELDSQSLGAVDSPVCNSVFQQPPVIGATNRLVALATQAANTVTSVEPV